MICVYADNIDGICAAAVVSMSVRTESGSFHSVSYSNMVDNDLTEVHDILDNVTNDLIYLCGISFSYGNIDFLKTIAKNNVLIWIDSSKNSIKLVNENKELKTIPGLIDENYSVSYNTWCCIYKTIPPRVIKYISDVQTIKFSYHNSQNFKTGLLGDLDFKDPLSDKWNTLFKDDKISTELIGKIINNGKAINNYIQQTK